MGSAVLLRAGAPVEGLAEMAANRGFSRPPRQPREPREPRRQKPGDLAGGPGKLSQALAIDRASDGVRLDRGPLRITHGTPVEEEAVVRGPRVGVDYAGEAAAWPLRFAVRGNPHVSRPRLG